MQYKHLFIEGAADIRMEKLILKGICINITKIFWANNPPNDVH
jgi:hypothetical protein